MDPELVSYSKQLDFLAAREVERLKAVNDCRWQLVTEEVITKDDLHMFHYYGCLLVSIGQQMAQSRGVRPEEIPHKELTDKVIEVYSMLKGEKTVPRLIKVENIIHDYCTEHIYH